MLHARYDGARVAEHPWEYTDTDPRAMEVWIRLQREMPPGEKLAAVLGGAQFALQLIEAGVRRRYPAADDREVLVRVAARHLPPDLVRRAYGWAPEANGQSR
jgi:hypothetical protein